MNQTVSASEHRAGPAGRGVLSVRKALQVLQELASSESGLGIAEIARRLKLHKSVVFRLVHTLEEAGFAERSSDNRRFQIGRMAFVVGNRHPRQHPIIMTAVEQLRRLIPEHTGYVGLLEGTGVVILASNEGTGPLRASPYMGQRRPLHSTALGKAVLASLPEAKAEAILREISLPAITPATITDLQALRAQLVEIRTRGYAEARQEARLGVDSIGAAVPSAADGSAPVGISVSFPSGMLDAAERASIVRRVLDAARTISELINLNGADLGRR